MVYSYSAEYWRALIILPVVVAVLLFVRFLPGSRSKRPPLWLVTAFGAFCFVAALSILYRQDRDIRRAMAANGAPTVEGTVTDFRPGSNDHRPERFRVHDVRFEYSDDGHPGFHQTAAEGGPIREGMCVRIRYYRNEFNENRILMLEVLGKARAAVQCRAM